MINFAGVLLKKNITEPNLNWLEIPSHPYTISIIGGSGSGKPNSFFNTLTQQPDINKTCLFDKYR